MSCSRSKESGGYRSQKSKIKNGKRQIVRLYSGRYDTSSSVRWCVRELVFDYSLSFNFPCLSLTLPFKICCSRIPNQEDFKKEQTQIVTNYSLNFIRTLLNFLKTLSKYFGLIIP